MNFLRKLSTPALISLVRDWSHLAASGQAELNRRLSEAGGAPTWPLPYHPVPQADGATTDFERELVH